MGGGSKTECALLDAIRSGDDNHAAKLLLKNGCCLMQPIQAGAARPLGTISGGATISSKLMANRSFRGSLTPSATRRSMSVDQRSGEQADEARDKRRIQLVDSRRNQEKNEAVAFMRAALVYQQRRANERGVGGKTKTIDVPIRCVACYFFRRRSMFNLASNCLYFNRNIIFSCTVKRLYIGPGRGAATAYA